MAKLTKNDLKNLGTDFDGKTPEEILAFAVDTYEAKVSLASSFGPEDMVLIHILSEVRPGARVFLLDTGYLFPETIDLVERTRNTYTIQLDTWSSDLSKDEMEKKYGHELYKTDPARCCEIRKIIPLKKA